ncbi:recombinase family protein [Streptomyces maoxianensis]|uniref:Recombinase family protein n=1 Tax=Streptomyces maoxianensis TaxID=1459942 RepID=A0ABV9G754_9ACTN
MTHRRPVDGPARPLHPGPDRDRVLLAQSRHRLHLALLGAQHHHTGRRLVFHVFAALAEFIRELIVEGTNDGLDAARARGARLREVDGPGRGVHITDDAAGPGSGGTLAPQCVPLHQP